MHLLKREIKLIYIIYISYIFIQFILFKLFISFILFKLFISFILFKLFIPFILLYCLYYNRTNVLIKWLSNVNIKQISIIIFYNYIII